MPKTSKPYTERINGTQKEPLPNGGAYAIATFCDADGTPKPKSRAAVVIITEYDQDGKPLAISEFSND